MFNSNGKIVLFVLAMLAIMAIIVALIMGVNLDPFRGIMDYLPWLQ